MDKRYLLGYSFTPHIDMKIQEIFHYVDNQNYIRMKYIETSKQNTADTKYKLLAYAIMMNSYYRASDYAKFKEAADIGEVDWTIISEIISSEKRSLPVQLKTEAKKFRNNTIERNESMYNDILNGMSIHTASVKYKLYEPTVKALYRSLNNSKRNKEYEILKKALADSELEYLDMYLLFYDIKNINELKAALSSNIILKEAKKDIRDNVIDDLKKLLERIC